jgi:dimethylargininase
MLALTHCPSPRMADCQRTFVGTAAIDCALAAQQHAAFCRALADCGLAVRVLDVNLGEPDGVFVEDTAVVLDEVAILSSMGAESRRAEPGRIEPVLAEYRPIERIEWPATLEGGDVLRIGRTLLVGRSPRTNAAGIEALREIAEGFGYRVEAITVRGCLHLKTACTALPDGRLLVNPAWIDPASLAGHDFLHIPPAEPWAANTLPIGHRVLLPAEHPQTADLLHRLGFEPHPVPLSEFAKAEGGVTCLSIVMAPVSHLSAVVGRR